MNSFISWIGGKKLLRQDIVKRFPENIGRYIEVFGGAGWVLFHKEKYADLEVYNDVNSNLVNLFRCVKYHALEVQRELSFILNSREVFMDYRDKYNCGELTDIQRAARFFFLIKTSYGTDVRSYGCINKNVSASIEYLTKVQNRLSRVVIEHKDFENLIDVYDRPNALFYLDPPYYGTEGYYNVEFKEDDHKRLAEILKSIKGKFLLSYNNCEFVRKLYRDFTIEEISRQNNLASRYKNREELYQELIIKNY